MSESVSDNLSRCLALSKTATGRQQLLQDNELNSICRLTAGLRSAWEKTLKANLERSSQTEELLLLLRITRNSCAAGIAAADILIRHNLHEAAAQLAEFVAQQHSSLGLPPAAEHQSPPKQQLDHQQAQDQESVLLTAVQLLVNLSNTHSTAVWQAMFPTRINFIACSSSDLVREAVALTILSCLRGSPEVLLDMLSPAASTIWLHLLKPLMPVKAANIISSSSNSSSTQTHSSVADKLHMQTSSAGHDSLCLLVKAVTLQYGRLQQVLQCLELDDSTGYSRTNNSDGAVQETSTECLRVNIAHAVLLHLVAAEAASVSPVATGDAAAQQYQQQLQPEQCLGWLRYVVRLLRHLWSATHSSTGSRHGTVAAYVLEATLQVLQSVVLRGDRGRALVILAAEGNGEVGTTCASNCVSQLYTLGLVDMLLDMLKQLGPPPKRQKQDLTAQQVQQSTHPATAPQQQQDQQPYAGYRADLIAVLSTFLSEDKSMQNAVMSAGGIEVLLNNCNLDDTAPLAREWALWAIRNMCQGNEDVQRYIGQFQAVEAVQSEELNRMGMELQLDNMTNKLKLVKKPEQRTPGQHAP